MARMRKCLGFTLIEMMVIITIVAVLVSIAVPSFEYIIKNYRLTSAGERLFNSINFARSQAIKTNSKVYISFVTGTSWCYGINVGSACNCNTAGNCGLGAVLPVGTNYLSLSATGLTSGAISFEGTHGATYTSNILITYTMAGSTSAVSVKVGMLGNPQLCSANVSGYQVCT